MSNFGLLFSVLCKFVPQLLQNDMFYFLIRSSDHQIVDLTCRRIKFEGQTHKFLLCFSLSKSVLESHFFLETPHGDKTFSNSKQRFSAVWLFGNNAVSRTHIGVTLKINPAARVSIVCQFSMKVKKVQKLSKIVTPHSSC